MVRLIRDITERKHAAALVQADLARLAKKHHYESIVSTAAHSVHQSTTLQDALENAVETRHTRIERIDGIEIFLCEGEDTVLKASTGLPDWLIEKIRRLPSPQGYTWKVIRDAGMAQKLGKPLQCLAEESMRRVMRYAWPGNVREVQNVVVHPSCQAVANGVPWLR